MVLSLALRVLQYFLLMLDRGSFLESSSIVQIKLSLFPHISDPWLNYSIQLDLIQDHRVTLLDANYDILDGFRDKFSLILNVKYHPAFRIVYPMEPNS